MMLPGCSGRQNLLGGSSSSGQMKASLSHLQFENEQLKTEVAKLKEENRSMDDRLVQEQMHNGDLAARLDDARNLLRDRGIDGETRLGSRSRGTRTADPGRGALAAPDAARRTDQQEAEKAARPRAFPATLTTSPPRPIVTDAAGDTISLRDNATSRHPVFDDPVASLRRRRPASLASRGERAVPVKPQEVSIGTLMLAANLRRSSVSAPRGTRRSGHSSRLPLRRPR